MTAAADPLTMPCEAIRPGCGQPATEVVVTVNGYVIDCCPTCAREQCDPIGTAA